MAWSIVIGDTDTYTIEATAAWSHVIGRTIAPDGTVGEQRHRVEIEGDITGSTVGADMVTLSEELTDQLVAERLRIKEGSTTRWDLTPAGSLIGPWVVEWATVAAPGNAGSRWRYRLVIECVEAGTQDGGTVYNLETSITTETNTAGEVVRKIWRASARAKTWQAALDSVDSFSPGEEKVSITEIIEKSAARATKTWTWEARKTSAGVLWVEETVEIAQGTNRYVEQPLAASDAFPLLHKRRNGITVVTVQGFVYGYDRSALKAPSQHVTESASVVRIEPRRWEPEIHDAKNGVYRLRFEEVYWASGTTPVISHADGHEKATFTTPPADGKAGE